MEILAFIISCVNLVLVIVAILKYKKLKDFVIADTVSRNEWDTEQNETSNRITGINGRMTGINDSITGINGRISALYDKYTVIDDLDASVSNVNRVFKNFINRLDSLDRDYNKALTGINDLYSAVDSIRLRMAGTVDANDKLGQENKNLEASTEEPIEPSDPFKSVVNTNLGPFGPREWPRDMVVDALNNASDNENSDEPRDRVVNVINNIHTSPTFWSKEEIDKHVDAMNKAVDASDSDQFLRELKTTMSMFADNDKFYGIDAGGRDGTVLEGNHTEAEPAKESEENNG